MVAAGNALVQAGCTVNKTAGVTPDATPTVRTIRIVEFGDAGRRVAVETEAYQGCGDQEIPRYALVDRRPQRPSSGGRNEKPHFNSDSELNDSNREFFGALPVWRKRLTGRDKRKNAESSR